MKTRKALKSDISVINNIMKLSKAFWRYDCDFIEAFMKKFAIDENYLIQNLVKVLFLENDLIIGFYSFIQNEQALELDNFFIHPDYIGKGVGRKLWGICCASAQKFHINEFTLISDPHAEMFYTKMGCKKIGCKESPILKDLYLPIMQFIVSAPKIGTSQ